MLTISDRLFSIIFLSPLKMASFSARHRLHLLPPHLYDGAVETMGHFIDGSTPLSFARQTSFDSSKRAQNVYFLLCNQIAPTPGLAFSLPQPCVLVAAS